MVSIGSSVKQGIGLRPDGKVDASQARRRLAHDLVEGVQRLTIHLAVKAECKQMNVSHQRCTSTYFTVSSAIKLVEMLMRGND